MKQAVEDILTHGLALLEDCTSESYTKVHADIFGATIGQHYRHVVDHFLCLMAGLATGVVSYDDRARDCALEQDLDQAATVTRMLLKFFQSTNDAELLDRCRVESALDYSEHKMVTVSSTFERELAYCVSHAVHHFAIVRLMCSAMSVNLPAEFGIAPSTLRHRANQLAN